MYDQISNISGIILTFVEFDVYEYYFSIVKIFNWLVFNHHYCIFLMKNKYLLDIMIVWSKLKLVEEIT